jgi:hypothetical protein
MLPHRMWLVRSSDGQTIGGEQASYPRMLQCRRGRGHDCRREAAKIPYHRFHHVPYGHSLSQPAPQRSRCCRRGQWPRLKPPEACSIGCSMFYTAGSVSEVSDGPRKLRRALAAFAARVLEVPRLSPNHCRARLLRRLGASRAGTSHPTVSSQASGLSWRRHEPRTQSVERCSAREMRHVADGYGT